MSRQLDLVIAEALGKWVEGNKIYAFNDDGSGIMQYIKDVSYYSSDGNAMLELDKEMRERGWDLLVRNDVNYHANYFKASGGNKAISHTEPLARALAAYKALTGKDWEEKGEWT